MATLKAPFALDRSLNTTEQTSRNIADVLADELSRITGRNASQVEYDNTESGLTADNVQDALDEIVEDIPTVPSVDIQTAVDEFSTYNGGLLSSLKVALSPNQNLHGYTEPWVGGAGKNKLGLIFTENPSRIVGMDFTHTESSFKLKGTSNSDAYHIFSLNYLPNFKSNTMYCLTAIADKGSFNGLYISISFRKDGVQVKRVTMNTGSTLSTPFDDVPEYDEVRFILESIPASTQYDLEARVQIEEGNSFTSFEPYSNICPISGHTQVKINNGKNLIGLGTRLDGYAGTTYFETVLGAVGYYFATSDLPDVVTISDVGGNRAYISYYNEVPAYGVVYLSKDQSQQTVPKTFTVDKTAEYVHIQLSYGTTDVTNIQIEEGSTATPYEPYNGYQVTVNLGGTYYSGMLDVVTGVFTPDTASVDLGSLTWTYQSNYPRFRADAPSGIKFPSSTSIAVNAICDIYKTVSMDVTQTKDSSIGIGTSVYPYIYAHDTRYTDADVYKTAMSGVMLVYELATPTTIQLSPIMVKALVGENHLSAPLEGQEITESKYKQMFTFDDVIAYIQSL